MGMIFANFEQIRAESSRRDLHHIMQDNDSDGEIMEAENVIKPLYIYM